MPDAQARKTIIDSGTKAGTSSQHRTTKVYPPRQRSVQYPPFKYTLNGLILEYSAPSADIKLSYTGDVTIQKAGVITGGLKLTKKGAQVEYQKEADGVFRGLFSQSTLSFDSSKRMASVSLASGSILKSGSKVLATSSYSFEPPDMFKFTFNGQEIKGTFQEFEFAGVFGYEMRVRPKLNMPESEPVQVPAGAIVVGALYVIAAGVIVVADAGKDAVTVGAGAVESPLSWAAAAALFAAGMAKIHGNKVVQGGA